MLAKKAENNAQEPIRINAEAKLPASVDVLYISIIDTVAASADSLFIAARWNALEKLAHEESF